MFTIVDLGYLIRQINDLTENVNIFYNICYEPIKQGIFSVHGGEDVDCGSGTGRLFIFSL